MRKTNLIGIIAFILAAALSACSGKNGSSEVGNPELDTAAPVETTRSMSIGHFEVGIDVGLAPECFIEREVGHGGLYIICDGQAPVIAKVVTDPATIAQAFMCPADQVFTGYDAAGITGCARGRDLFLVPKSGSIHEVLVIAYEGEIFTDGILVTLASGGHPSGGALANALCQDSADPNCGQTAAEDGGFKGQHADWNGGGTMTLDDDDTEGDDGWDGDHADWNGGGAMTIDDD